MVDELTKARAVRYRANKKAKMERLEQELAKANAEIERLRGLLARMPDDPGYKPPQRQATAAELRDMVANKATLRVFDE